MPKRHIYQFEWDPIKAKKNLRDHGVPFERATAVFLDEAALSVYDDDHSENEDRWITIGIDSIGILLVVNHTFQAESEKNTLIRLFSARKATKKEINSYRR